MKFESQEPDQEGREVQIWIKENVIIGPKSASGIDSAEELAEDVISGEFQMTDYDLVRITDTKGKTLAERTV